jgi:hypothetical protein
MRIHSTIQARPAEVFAVLEAPVLAPAPDARYDLPTWTVAKVHRDHHIQVARALYSVPGELIGQQVAVRADSKLVKILHRGQVIKIHPRLPAGGRATDEADLPSEVTAYALRDLDKLIRQAARHGTSVGAYASALLDSPLPWTKMRAVYRLLGLAKKFGSERVEQACARALGVRGRRRGADHPHGRTRRRERPAPGRRHRDRSGRPVRPCRGRVRRRQWRRPMTSPTITPELKALLRRVKFGKSIDTLPERLTLAKQNRLEHAEFLELMMVPARPANTPRWSLPRGNRLVPSGWRATRDNPRN